MLTLGRREPSRLGRARVAQWGLPESVDSLLALMVHYWYGVEPLAVMLWV